MKHGPESKPQPPLDGFAVQRLEQALSKSPTKSIILVINNARYQLSREGNWFKFSMLTKKRVAKRSTIVESLADVYNNFMHGAVWQIATV